MRKILIKFLQQGVWASLSGGWYYDSHYSSFTNIFHLYTWLFLLCFPFILYIIAPLHWIVIVSYVSTLIVFFATLKAVNSYLHHTFDCSNQVEKRVVETNKDEESKDDSNSSTTPTNGADASNNRVIESLTSSLQPVRSNEDLARDHDSDDVAGHKKLWDDMQLTGDLNELVEMMKDDFSDDVNKAQNDEDWSSDWIFKKKAELIDKSNKASVDVHTSNEGSTSVLPLKGKHKRRSKHNRRGASVDTCVSITSLSSSSDVDQQSHSDYNASSSSDDVSDEQPSTSQGLHNRIMKRRAGFRAHTRPTKFSNRSLEHVLEQPSTMASNAVEETTTVEPVNQQTAVKEVSSSHVQETEEPQDAGGDASRNVEKEIIKNEISVMDNSESTNTKVDDYDPVFEALAKISTGFSSVSSTTTPTRRDSMEDDDVSSIKLSKLFTSEAKTNQAVVMKQDLEVQHVESSALQGAGDAKESIKTTDDSHLPLLAGKDPSKEETKPARRKKVTVSHSAPTKIEYTPMERREGSLSLEEESLNDHLQSLGLDIEKAVRPGRHRHPAGLSPASTLRRLNFSAPSSPANDDEPSTSLAKSDPHVKYHLATDFTDTTEGAVHGYQDADGNYYAYAFTSDGVASELRGNDPLLQFPSQDRSHRSSRPRSRRRTGGSSSSTSTSHPLAWLDFIDDTEPHSDPLRRSNFGSRRPRRLSDRQFLINMLQRSMDARRTVPAPNFDAFHSSLSSQLNVTGRPPTPKVKLFYKLKLPFKSVTIQYDRLALMDLLDRNMLTTESIFSIVLAALVGVLGLYILSLSFLHEIWIFWMCVVMATSQYSLIKSVQPDSSSPTHGHNRVVAYSRPVYFILAAFLFLIFHYLSDANNIRLQGIPLYSLTVFDNHGFAFGRDFMMARPQRPLCLVFILLLPVIFLFGFLPQVNTLLIYLCEQVEMHMFGGTASVSVPASLFSVTRSIITALLLYGFCYGALISQEKAQNILYSAFCGFLISFSYHLSRQSSSPTMLWSIVKSQLMEEEKSTSSDDPAKEANSVSGEYFRQALIARLQSDVIVMPIITILAFALHSTSIFTFLQHPFTVVLLAIVSVVGFLLHYLTPQLRKNLPWLLFTNPILKSREHDLFEVTESAHVMWYEEVYSIGCFVEKNLLLPLYILNELTKQANPIIDLYGSPFGCVVLTVVGMKMVRSAFTMPAMQYPVYLFSYLYVNYDDTRFVNSVFITYFFFGIIIVKLQELVLKLHFLFVYISPWQMSWGSTFHAFAQPFSVPHSAIMLAQALLASLIQAPFVPFLGSAIFHTSYARPLKFWEKNYNTKRVDHSNTKLANQVDRLPQSDDNNLNSVFYEHLTFSLQKALAGDIALGRWGNVYAGDYFILASDYLNAMVHIIEKGNGMVTFQLRGLEFSGTYCQQREVEAINEGADNNDNCCCCSPRRIKGLLSFNSAFTHRWMAWQVLAINYTLDGYSITDNNATTMLGVFDLRKILITYIVKSIIYFLIRHDSLEQWIENEAIREQIVGCEKPQYVELDSTFAVTVDDDYDTVLFGVSRAKFCDVYRAWISHCCQEREKTSNKVIDCQDDSKLVTLCFAISVLGRRALGTASSNLSSNLDCFLHGLHALFKGDFRITSSKDEWVFNDMNLIQQVVAPGVRMALKLHQDHFACPDDHEEPSSLYEAIEDYTRNMLIAHEADPVWRRAVLSNTSSLLALRRVASESFVDQYSVVTLNHRALGFKLVKINKECVRGLWAGQQSELIFLRNRNPERGSIQNAKQVLRNMINSSCDQPIGYPIYVSPLTTSFATSNEQYTKLVKGPITFQSVRHRFNVIMACLRESCTGSCNSGGMGGGMGQPPPAQVPDRSSSIQMLHFANIPRNPQPPSSASLPDRGVKPEYATTTFSTSNPPRLERGSDASSRVSNRDTTPTIPDVPPASGSHRSALPTVLRLSCGGSSIESSAINRSRPNSYSVPQSSSIKRATRSVSTSGQL